MLLLQLKMVKTSRRDEEISATSTAAFSCSSFLQSASIVALLSILRITPQALRISKELSLSSEQQYALNIHLLLQLGNRNTSLSALVRYARFQCLLLSCAALPKKEMFICSCRVLTVLLWKPPLGCFFWCLTVEAQRRGGSDLFPTMT